jgi:hypothetical protein
VERDPNHLALGARGGDLVRGEDMDLMLTALDLGLGLGRFPSLRLEHIIPAERLKLDYVARLMAGIACGQSLMEFIRFKRRPQGRPTGLRQVEALLQGMRVRRLPPPLRALHDAERAGHERAREIIAGWEPREDAAPAAGR